MRIKKQKVWREEGSLKKGEEGAIAQKGNE